MTQQGEERDKGAQVLLVAEPAAGVDGDARLDRGADVGQASDDREVAGDWRAANLPRYF